MRKFLFTFSLLALCAIGVSAQECETSEGGTASVKIYRTERPVLPGRFTVSSKGDKVRFAKGNLRYQASSNTWDIMEQQYLHYGASDNPENGNQTAVADRPTQEKWIDLFGCCTTGWSGGGATAYQPWEILQNLTDTALGMEIVR